ncbi:hypothetical protein [Streptomyces sp. MAR4 CNX-425]|uniref:hypothetical protein n=1 Tax=Streptomyces sp. MAR4 CNX-425 TaxID=3406343 RepID=UPI003B514A37
MSWYRLTASVSNPADLEAARTLSERVYAVLEKNLERRLTIREPELHNQLRNISPWRHFDGAIVSSAAASDLIESMLLQEGFWCRLESSILDIHVGEGEIYLGVRIGDASAAEDIVCLGLRRVRHSPYAIVRPRVHPYRPADGKFWDVVRQSVDGCGESVLLVQWAGGMAGEKWYLLHDGSEVSAAEADLPPRSICALFPAASSLRVEDEESELWTRIENGSVPYGNVRLLSKSRHPLRKAAMVSDRQEFDESVRRERGIKVSHIVVWPQEDEHEPLFAVCADVDGVVRSSALFD